HLLVLLGRPDKLRGSRRPGRVRHGGRRALAALGAGAALLWAAPSRQPAAAPQPVSAPLLVKETAGLRRFAYPIVAQVPFAPGTARAEGVFLLKAAGGRTVAAQFDPRERWPDGSLKWLDVSFNASPGPLEQQQYT